MESKSNQKWKIRSRSISPVQNEPPQREKKGDSATKIRSIDITKKRGKKNKTPKKDAHMIQTKLSFDSK